MSVEYRAVVSYGWVVSSDEVRQLDDDIYDELTSNYMLVCQDGWAGDSDYVYGNYIYSCDEGTIYTLNTGALAVDKRSDEIMKFYDLFPSHMGELPQLHVMVQVY
jgi:hypothetical protein